MIAARRMRYLSVPAIVSDSLAMVLEDGWVRTTIE